MGADATGVRASAYPAPRSAGWEGVKDRVAAYRGRLWRAEILAPTLAAIIVGALLVTLYPGQGDPQPDLARKIGRTEVLAALAAHEVAKAAGLETPGAAHLRIGAGRLPANALSGDERLFLVDDAGRLIASYPERPAGGHIGDLTPDGEALLFLTDRGGMAVRMADGSSGLGAARPVGGVHLAVLRRGEAGPTAASRHGRLAMIACFGLAAFAGACAVHARRARQARVACERIQERVDLSLARGRCGLWDWDMSRGRVRWSDSLYVLLGYERRGDWMGFSEVNALIHPDDGDLYALADRIAASASPHVEHEFRLRDAGGAWLWMRARAQVVEDGAARSRHLVGIAFDITEERGILEKTARDDARLRDAVEAISEAFVIWDSENRLVLCNSKFRAFHALPAEVARPGATYGAIVDAGRPPVVLSHVARDNPGETGARALEAKLADGRWLQIDERRTRDGGYVSVGTDITALKLQEERLIESERRLMGTVRDLKRSREILERQTQQLAELAEQYHEQKGEAESASRAKSEFLAKMSHEFRTPLNAVIGFSEVMLGGTFGPLGHDNYRDYVASIRKGGLDLLALVNDILQISRIEAGHVRIEAEPVALGDAVEVALRSVGSQTDAKALAVSCRGEAGFVQADPAALHQILLQVLGNAAKFTPEGGAIDVRTSRSGDRLNLFVADSGIGIPAAFLARLGKPFEQGLPEFRRGHTGSGLGLAIATALAALQGGTIRVRSREGVGTVVMLSLPAAAPGIATAERPRLAA